MSLQTNAMVLNLQIGLWAGYKFDKSATARFTAEAAANPDAARVNKHLVPKESLAAVQSAAGALRTHFYATTLPWKDNGDRLLTRKGYQDFIHRHGELVREFNAAVDEFADDKYSTALAQAEFRMGELFNPDDYPSVDEVRRKFYVSLDIDAVTSAKDFRVGLDDSDVDQIRTDLESATQARITAAMKHVWAKLEDTLGHFASKMDDDQIFRDTTVSNLEELVDMLPSLNLTDDPQLAAIGDAIRQRVLGSTPKEIRKNDGLRAAVGVEAKAIMDEMAGFMRAFGG